jgi:hypothetical protein
LLDSDQIEKFRKSEMRRGDPRRPKKDPKIAEQQRRRKETYREILWAEETVVADIEEAMIGQGILPGSQQWDETLNFWRSERRRRRLPL